MNTDNMSILGLTIDYGPYGWIESFDLDWTPNITDASGRRYRFGHQPQIAQWNLAQLGRALLPLVDDAAPLRQTIERFSAEFSSLHRHSSLRKLGLSGRRDTWAEDDELLGALGALLTELETDMPLWFRLLGTAPIGDVAAAIDTLRGAYYAPDAVTSVQHAMTRRWLEHYAQRVAVEGLGEPERHRRIDAINPRFVPRNYLVQQVIEATERGDRAALPELLDVLRHPYDEQPGRERFAEKRPDWARHKPGCSMLSCSS
jgi:uncharacterized protein YdiU (UPF0061 family)